ncbi:MAG: Arm DNA-binding domain-containing protein [Bilophila wadsworthia]
MYIRPFCWYSRWHLSIPAKAAKTDTKLRALKPSGKVQKLLDCDGCTSMSHLPGKLWRLFYRFDGKQKTLALGKYPEVSLAEARKSVTKHGL